MIMTTIAAAATKKSKEHIVNGGNAHGSFSSSNNFQSISHSNKSTSRRQLDIPNKLP